MCNNTCRRPMLNGRTMSLARPAHTASIVILRFTQAPLLRVLSCQSQPGAGLCHRLRTEHKTGAEGRRCGRRQAVHTFTAHMLQCNAHRWPMNSVSQERKIEGCYIATPSSLGLPGGAGWRQHAQRHGEGLLWHCCAPPGIPCTFASISLPPKPLLVVCRPQAVFSFALRSSLHGSELL